MVISILVSVLDFEFCPLTTGRLFVKSIVFDHVNQNLLPSISPEYFFFNPKSKILTVGS